jgi:hypothetical protein
MSALFLGHEDHFLYLEVIRAGAHIYGLDCDEKRPVLYILHLSEWLGFHLEFIYADVHISGANRKPRGQEWLHPNHSLRQRDPGRHTLQDHNQGKSCPSSAESPKASKA